MGDIKSTTSRTQKIGPHLLGKVLQDINRCKSCDYCQSNKILEPIKKLVRNPYLFISDGPEESEDILREPFTSNSGRLLRSIISSLLPPEKYWLCYTVFCTPYEDFSIVAPSHLDTLRCSHNLISLIDYLKPRRIIALGKIASKTLKALDYSYESLVHPSAILKNGGSHSITGIRFSLQLERMIEIYG